MDTKEYLGTLRLFEARIDQKKEQLRVLKRRRSHFAAPDRSEKISRLKSEISEQIVQLESLRGEIIDRIQSLDNYRFVRVLYMHYVEYKSFDQIAAEVGYALSHTYRIHRDALAALEKVSADRQKRVNNG